MLVYLAGCISYYIKNNMTEKAVKWREVAKAILNKHGYRYFDPMINFHTNNNTYFSENLIVQQNILYLKKSDIILANLENLKYSPGTLFEIYFAYLHDKPVIGFGYDSYIDSPHIKASISILCVNLEEALQCLMSYFHLKEKNTEVLSYE